MRLRDGSTVRPRQRGVFGVYKEVRGVLGVQGRPQGLLEGERSLQGHLLCFESVVDDDIVDR